MDTLEAIFTRRSIRKFTGKPITDEQLHAILRAGFSAPTAMNNRPWQFIVLRDPEVLKAVTRVHPYSRMLPEAGCGILICGDRTLGTDEGYMHEDCAAATENMLLAAQAQGLGAVWLGVHPSPGRSEALAKLTGVPQSVVPIALIAVGNPAETRTAPDRYEPAKVHFDRW